MKLAIVIPGFQSGRDDWCIPAFTNLARELARHAEVHVFATRYPHFRRDYRMGAVRVHALGGGAIYGARVPLLSLFNLWRTSLQEIRHEHRLGKFDGIVGIWATESGWLASWAARRLSVPSVVHLAGGELACIPAISYGNRRPGLAGMLVARTLVNSSLLTVPSRPVERLLARHFPLAAQKARRWSLGVDTTQFSPRTSTAEEARAFTFTMLGSLIPVKGHAWVLAACATLRKLHPDFDYRLVIAGSGPLRSELEKGVRALDLEGYVDFLGDVPYGQLPSLLGRTDCFLVGSWYEAQCMAVLEAMACGVPWIGPPVGVLPELAGRQNGPGSGFVVGRRSPEALAAAMRTMATRSAADLRAMAATARAQVERDFDHVKQVGRLLAILEEAALERASSRWRTDC